MRHRAVFCVDVWQTNNEPATTIQFAFDSDLTIMGTHDRLADAQAQAGTTLWRLRNVAPDAISAKESIKDVWQFVGRDARAGVRHGQHGGSRCFINIDRDGDRTASGCKLQCIVHQVIDDLSQVLLVAFDSDRRKR